MKIKIIDLLNKIANHEEVPEKIRDGVFDLTLCKGNKGYHYGGNTTTFLNNVLGMERLNDEVEIIEEPKNIEKIEMYQDEEGQYFLNNRNSKIYIRCDETDFMVDKFNELIDEINNLKEK